MISANLAEREINCDSRKWGTPINEVDLTAESPEESCPKVIVVTGRRVSHSFRKNEFLLAEQVEKGGLGNLSKLFDKSLLAELVTEVT